MDCKTAKTMMREAADREMRNLPGELSGHIAACPSCAREYGLLKLIADSMRKAEYYAPSANFNYKVMASLGYRTLPAYDWKLWLEGGVCSMAACVIAAAACAVFSGITPVSAVRAVLLLSHPYELAFAVKVAAAKAGFALLGASDIVYTVISSSAAQSALAGFFAAAVLAASAAAVAAANQLSHNINGGK